MATLVPWLLAAMASWVPIEDHAWQESRARTEARYLAIATAIEDVTLDPAEAPLPVLGLTGALAPPPEVEERRAWTALVLAAIASRESFFRRDIDECRTPGDGGAVPAWGLFQLAVPRSRVCGDRTQATRAALGMVRESIDSCRKLSAPDRLALYTNGRCERSPSSRARLERAIVFWAKTPWFAPLPLVASAS